MTTGPDNWTATVRGRRWRTPHVVSVTLVLEGSYPTTGIPDEYLRLDLTPHEADAAPVQRVYTIADHRIIDGRVEIDFDIALHDREGPGSAWAISCRPGDQVAVTAPHGLFVPPPDTVRHHLVADLTGVPAVGRILRQATPEQHFDVTIVVQDPADVPVLPSAAEVDLKVEVVSEVAALSTALESAAMAAPTDDRYLWVAGEARATRAVRKHLRRTLRRPQATFYACGYWQLDAERWQARFAKVADEVVARALEAEARTGDDHGAYLDALEDIYEAAGL